MTYVDHQQFINSDFNATVHLNSSKTYKFSPLPSVL